MIYILLQTQPLTSVEQDAGEGGHLDDDSCDAVDRWTSSRRNQFHFMQDFALRGPSCVLRCTLVI